MRLPRRTFLHLAAGAAALSVVSVIAATLSGQEARSQTTRTIKIVVPLTAGGLADILARLLSEEIGRAHGPTMIVENRPGAGAVIGTEAVSRAEPDGNTLLIAAPAFIISPHLRKLTYDPLTSFEPICLLTRTPAVIVVNSKSPYNTLADLLDAERAKPGAVIFAGVPVSVTHIAFEMLKRSANVNITFVPYPGGAPAVNALLGEHVTAMAADYPTVAELIKAGKLRALASLSRARIEELPEVPTLAESGHQGIEVDFWNGLFAPAKTPKEVVSRVAGWFTDATAQIKPKLVARGLYPVGLCGAEFGAFLRKQHDEFGRIIQQANIKAE